MSRLLLSLLLLAVVVALCVEGRPGHRGRPRGRGHRRLGGAMMDRMGRRGINPRRARHWMSRFCNATVNEENEPRDIVTDQLSNNPLTMRRIGDVAAADDGSDGAGIMHNRHDRLASRMSRRGRHWRRRHGRRRGGRGHMRHGRMHIRNPRRHELLCQLLTENQCQIPEFLNCSNNEEQENEEEEGIEIAEIEEIPMIQ